jgi:hypothetical protein
MLALAIVVALGATADVLFDFGWGNDWNSVLIALFISSVACVTWLGGRFIGWLFDL